MDTHFSAVLHIVAGLAAVPVSFSFLPMPWAPVVASVWAGIVAAVAYYNTNYANSQK